MDDLFIDKRTKEEDLYVCLQRSSLDELQRLAGEVWTDYNAHDPGVTLNEAVNYALTELDYRLRFGLPDYLALPEANPPVWKFGLYSPLQVFPTAPVTADDYRRLITDRLDEVINVWIYPQPGQPGWYDMLVELSPETGRGSHAEVERKIRKIYHANRNLGEGLHEVRFIRRESLTMVADMEVEGTGDATELLAQIYWETQQFFIEGLSFRRVEDLLAQGMRLDEIINGPELTKWAIRQDSLKSQCSLYLVPLLYKRLLQLEGVKGIYTLYFTDGVRVYDSSIGAESAERSYTVKIPSSGHSPRVRLRVGKALVPVSPEKIPGYIYGWNARLYGIHNVTHDLRPFMRYGEGTYRAMYRHDPVGGDLPACYGVNEQGVASSAPALRKAQARQLQGYLQLFDSVFEQGLGELEDIPRLMDIQAPLAAGGAELRRQEMLIAFRDRLYGENSNPGVLTEYNFYDESRAESVERRRNFQRGIPRWGHDRLKGVDLYDLTPGNVAGIKAYMAALLGWEGGLEQPVVNLFPLYNLKMVDDRKFYKGLQGSLSHNFVIDAPLKDEQTEHVPHNGQVFTDSDYYDLKRVIPLLHYNLIFGGLFRGGVRLENFRMVNLWQETDRLLVFHHYDGEWDEWVNLGRFDSRAGLVRAANCLHRFLVMLNRRSETMYVVEHHLLPEGEPLTVSVVFPGWSVRMADARFRAGCEELVASRLPAHLEVRFCWLDAVRMWKFEKAYYAWRKEYARGEVGGETVRLLKEAMG